MGFYIDSSGGYYEGDKINQTDIVVPRRPDVNHSWSAGSWVPIQPAVPVVVTMRQARLALLNAGLLPSVSNTIAGLLGTSGDAARIEWEFSPTLKRDHPLVASLSASLGLTSAQLDALFTAAALL